MKFEEGKTTEILCPECEGEGKATFLVMEMSFKDCWSYNPRNEGHYTIDWPILFCPKCEYTEDYDGESEEDI